MEELTNGVGSPYEQKENPSMKWKVVNGNMFPLKREQLIEAKCLLKNGAKNINRCNPNPPTSLSPQPFFLWFLSASSHGLLTTPLSIYSWWLRVAVPPPFFHSRRKLICLVLKGLYMRRLYYRKGWGGNPLYRAVGLMLSSPSRRTCRVSWTVELSNARNCFTRVLADAFSYLMKTKTVIATCLKAYYGLDQHKIVPFLAALLIHNHYPLLEHYLHRDRLQGVITV